MSLILSDKYKDFIKHKAPVEFLEGTTAAGKTTVGVFKFMLMIAQSSKKQHIISGLDKGTVEKNIITKDLGILDLYGELVEYNASGRKDESLPHIVFHCADGDKVIYILGYDDKARWKKALGGQYGCLYIDEINIADMEYVEEAMIRCDYCMATLNPDDPNLPVYTQFINHARPIDKYKDDAPRELLNMLNETVKSNWTWWFFSFEHNWGLTKEKIEQIKANSPVGTKRYKNKILGLRCKATGLVFSNFDRHRHLITKDVAKGFINGKNKEEYFVDFTAGLDTSYSQKSPDTIAMSFAGITNKGRVIVLDERVYSNQNREEPIAPSDTVINFVDFLDRNKKDWGFARNVFIDSADQATITEFTKYKRKNGCVYTFNPAWKQTTIIDRVELQLGWFACDKYLIVDTCKEYIRELEIYSWNDKKDNQPEDGNDHMINSTQYAWLPYKMKIGVETNGNNGRS